MIFGLNCVFLPTGKFWLHSKARQIHIADKLGLYAMPAYKPYLVTGRNLPGQNRRRCGQVCKKNKQSSKIKFKSHQQ